eukprot:CAMPEP_0195087168 /NCGR_PEP_ID=MMETSP0448-20130528/27093_1 /TAXON_ID=66468 /ORGANISM="Heterocapsa triquestra, Strain CCMP 448" /LENGTH=102 /DNA_ID=CAMNT_0040120709 /DNA_START=37 /DNA_END=342 /DNA_ORIENTATION=+
MRVNMTRGGLCTAIAYAHPSILKVQRYAEGAVVNQIVAVSVIGTFLFSLLLAGLPYLKGFQKIQNQRVDEALVVVVLLWYMMNCLLWDPPTMKIIGGVPLDD